MLKRATQFLNPSQIPVIALDAPLYALVKYVQWNWPQTHGESKYVVMFGGLHIEMEYIGRLLGVIWLDCCTNSGRYCIFRHSRLFLEAVHLSRTRHAHQVSTLALSKLQQDVFLQRDHMTRAPKMLGDYDCQNPTFQYWDTALQMEILSLIFVRSHRQQDFSLYVESLPLGSLPLTTITMLGGFPFTSVTWKFWMHQSVRI